MSKKTVEPYSIIPEVPEDFDGAVAVHREACSAIVHWGVLHKTALIESEKHIALNWLKKWRRIKGQAQGVIQSFQMRLF